MMLLACSPAGDGEARGPRVAGEGVQALSNVAQGGVGGPEAAFFFSQK